MRCFSCGKVIGDKWDAYLALLIEGRTEGEALTELQLHRYCCRRMVLTHVDLIERLLHYNSTYSTQAHKQFMSVSPSHSHKQKRCGKVPHLVSIRFPAMQMSPFWLRGLFDFLIHQTWHRFVSIMPIFASPRLHLCRLQTRNKMYNNATFPMLLRMNIFGYVYVWVCACKCWFACLSTSPYV